MGNELDYNYFLSGEDFDADYVLKTFKIVPLYYIIHRNYLEIE